MPQPWPGQPFVSLEMPHGGDLQPVKCPSNAQGWGGGGMSGLGIGRAKVLKFMNLLVISDIHTSTVVFPCMLKVICIWFGFTLLHIVIGLKNLHLSIDFAFSQE